MQEKKKSRVTVGGDALRLRSGNCEPDEITACV